MKSPKQITEHDILIFLEESFPTINRGGNIYEDFTQIMGQHGAMISILAKLLNDEDSSQAEYFQKSIQKVLTAKRKRTTR